MKQANRIYHDHAPFLVIFAERAAEAVVILRMLEAVSEHVGECYSPAIILTGIGELHQHFPYAPRYIQWVTDSSGARIGVNHINGNIIAPEIFGQYDEIIRLADALYKRHAAGEYVPNNDPAFEIVRHLRNNWWGRKEPPNISYPNPVADKILGIARKWRNDQSGT